MLTYTYVSEGKFELMEKPKPVLQHERDADAKKYDTLTFTKVLEDQLAVMDGTAATLCRDNKLPILVFDLADPDNIARAVQGENVGTLVYEG